MNKRNPNQYSLLDYHSLKWLLIQVVCNQLGFTSGGISHSSGHQWGAGSGDIWMDDVACTGSETSVLSCTHSTSHNCNHGKDVAVVCN